MKPTKAPKVDASALKQMGDTQAQTIQSLQKDNTSLTERLTKLEATIGAKKERRTDVSGSTSKALPEIPVTFQEKLGALEERIKTLEDERSSNKYLSERKIATALVSFFSPNLLESFVTLPSGVNIIIGLCLFGGVNKAAESYNQQFVAILDSINTKLEQSIALAHKFLSYLQPIKDGLVLFFTRAWEFCKQCYGYLKSVITFLFNKVASFASKIADLEWGFFMFITKRWFMVPAVPVAASAGFLYARPDQTPTWLLDAAKYAQSIGADKLINDIVESPYTYPVLLYFVLPLLGLGALHAAGNKVAKYISPAEAV